MLIGVSIFVKTQYIVSYVYFNLFVYITRNFSFPLEMYGQPFFPGPSQHREYYRTL